ncbi:MAG: hypothetical protein JWN48_4332 [Myxococcaceae bacterium]|nr:hypothetical protein [Myxococcaceae bacterium]
MKAQRRSWIAAVLSSVIACSSNPTQSGQSAAESPDEDSSVGGSQGTSADAGKPGRLLDASIPPSIDAGPSRSGDAGPSRSGDAGQSEREPAASDGGAVGALVDAASVDAAPAGDHAFQTCTEGLKSKCRYDDKEIACSSVVTQAVPLSAGGSAGNVEIPFGPYGAYVEWNQGKAFANPVSLLEGTCDVLASSFGEPASVTSDVLDLRGADLGLYTVFRPACMKEGETYPVITWGNGTCGQTGGYAALLATVASHGFVIIAANSRFTDQGNREMLHALDFAKAANDDAKSTLYKRLDLTKVGAMGHSQGSSATAHAATDPRIKALILWNGGASGDPAKPFLAVSGDRDIGNPTPTGYASYVDAATKPGAWLFFHKVLETGGNVTGHLTLMEQAERATDFTVAWWKYILQGDGEAKKTFVGADCGLCNHKADYEYGQHGLL